MRRTDITPHGYDIVHIVPPDDGVDAVYDVRNEEPGDHGEGGYVACTPVPGQRHEQDEGGEESDDGEFAVHGA